MFVIKGHLNKNKKKKTPIKIITAVDSKMFTLLY